ncbi:MAG: hypothetical protein Q8K22_08940, partial [Rhodoferax sp.]|nr:hypothetical protein [Rhodoferax sp.]
MKRRLLNQWLAVLVMGSPAWLALPAHAADEAPDAFIQRLSTEVLDGIKADKAIQSGEVARVV